MMQPASRVPTSLLSIHSSFWNNEKDSRLVPCVQIKWVFTLSDDEWWPPVIMIIVNRGSQIERKRNRISFRNVIIESLFEFCEWFCSDELTCCTIAWPIVHSGIESNENEFYSKLFHEAHESKKKSNFSAYWCRRQQYARMRSITNNWLQLTFNASRFQASTNVIACVRMNRFELCWNKVFFFYFSQQKTGDTLSRLASSIRVHQKPHSHFGRIDNYLVCVCHKRSRKENEIIS